MNEPEKQDTTRDNESSLADLEASNAEEVKGGESTPLPMKMPGAVKYDDIKL